VLFHLPRSATVRGSADATVIGSTLQAFRQRLGTGRLRDLIEHRELSVNPQPNRDCVGSDRFDAVDPASLAAYVVGSVSCAPAQLDAERGWRHAKYCQTGGGTIGSPICRGRVGMATGKTAAPTGQRWRRALRRGLAAFC